jgi:hypothetical protein
MLLGESYSSVGSRPIIGSVHRLLHAIPAAAPPHAVDRRVCPARLVLADAVAQKVEHPMGRLRWDWRWLGGRLSEHQQEHERDVLEWKVFI